jgi:hypothetical protein
MLITRSAGLSAHAVAEGSRLTVEAVEVRLNSEPRFAETAHMRVQPPA